jgi:hypothetical protein
VKIHGDRPAPNLRFRGENSNAPGSSAITHSFCNFVSNNLLLDTVSKADKSEVNAGHDPAEAVEERVAIKDVKEDFGPSSKVF